MPNAPHPSLPYYPRLRALLISPASSIMRQVKVKTASGTVHFNYTISTPKNENAKSIDSSLPTIVFLHPVYIGHVIFHRERYFN